MELYILIIAFVAINVLTFQYVYKSLKQKTTMGKSLAGALLASLIVVYLYVGNFFTRSQNLMNIMCSFEHVIINWILYHLLFYVIDLTKEKVHKAHKLVVIGILGIDSIILSTNPINGIAGDFFVRQRGTNTLVTLRPHAFFWIHTGICGLILGVMLFFLIKASVKAPSIYKPKYLIVTCVITIVVGFYAAFLVSKTALFDISRFLYGIGSLLLYFATYDWLPESLTKRLQGYVDENISDATIIYDVYGEIVKINSKANYMISSSISKKKDSLLKFLSFSDEETICERTIDGNVYTIHYKPILDKKGKVYGYVFIFHDITEGKQLLEREHHAAIYDPLTGCYNRRGFFEEAKKFISEEKFYGGFVVLVSGICDFKGINGLYGTKTGDMILKEIAKKYHEFHHKFPMLYARSAEGKFSCILPFEYLDELVDETSRLIITIEDGVSLRVDLCHGFVMMSDIDKPVEYYYELSLLALARCKKRLSTSVMEYSKDMAKEQRRKQLMLSEMRDSIEAREFYIELQPQVDLKRNKVVGAEALVRWNHPILKQINPDEFIPLFEDNGFITKLDAFVWREAARSLKKFRDRGNYEGSISVNVSRVDIMCMEVSKEMEKITDEFDIPRDKFHIEITESACIDNKDALIATMNDLREKGFIVEIDDFGSGYSSLNALMHLPFDIVKLDMEFMKVPKRNEKCDVIISAMAGMIHDLGAKIIVEGVETEANVESARYIESDAAQGFFYSKPLSVNEFENFFERYNI